MLRVVSLGFSLEDLMREVASLTRALVGQGAAVAGEF
jgi:hypothetical protein